jgi:hypothetical protein
MRKSVLYARRVVGAFSAAAKRAAAAISSERDGGGDILVVVGTSSPFRKGYFREDQLSEATIFCGITQS